MVAAKPKTKETKPKTKQVPEEEPGSEKNVQSTRETVESVVVAFILAFLFRAFVAEAFVIPTGSMAPTLMGAHKDLFCEHCGQQYQASASIEYDSTTGALQEDKTIASTCPNCRGINAYDFLGNKNHTTFSGDRILVSKFDYVLAKPQRWDVLVFKWPLGARMNYIKRLIGLPGETLSISEGDIFIRSSDDGTWDIARKPPHKIQAMKQLVSNTRQQPADLIAKGWPSLWQPWSPTGEHDNLAWRVENSESNWSAELSNNSEPQWLRYYHKFASLETWKKLDQGMGLPSVDPHGSQLITDYLAYNTPTVLDNAEQLFELTFGSWDRYLPGILRRGPRYEPDEEKTGGLSVFQASESMRGISFYTKPELNDGFHWVGDLTGQFELEIQSEAGELMLDLVEFGIHFQCTIKVATGEAVLRAMDGQRVLPVFNGAESVTAHTSISGPGRYTIEMANVDDQIVLWVDRSPVEFADGSTYQLRAFRNGTARRPYWTAKDPLDAAPLGIGGKNLAMKVHAARVYRDIYYIADQSGSEFSDYPLNSASLTSVIPDAQARAGLYSDRKIIEAVYSHPEWWSQTSLFQKRRSKEFSLDEKQYFPMGDNSASSSDARAWFGHHYVEERFLLGKALLVFWPHTWNTPVPFTPNFRRMGLIR